MDSSFYESLPETVDLRAILEKFLDDVRKAKDAFEISVAAGVAWNALKGLDG